MNRPLTILIADRNPHVRDFLRREVTADGHRVRLAPNGRQLIKLAALLRPLDLIILDPDLPDTDASGLLTAIFAQTPPLRVILHTYPSDYEKHHGLFNKAVFIEKKGNSIERLKQVIAEIMAEDRGGAGLGVRTDGASGDVQLS